MSTYIEYGGFAKDRKTNKMVLIYTTSVSEKRCWERTLQKIPRFNLARNADIDPNTVEVLCRVVERNHFGWAKTEEEAKRKKKDPWIPVETKMPIIEEDMKGTEDLLLTVKFGRKENGETVCAGYLSKDGKWHTYMAHDCCIVGSDVLGEGDQVTAWMPSPKPYHAKKNIKSEGIKCHWKNS